MSNKEPVYRVYSVQDNGKKGGQRKSFWNDIGVVFAHSDGEGFDVLINQLPVTFFTDGRLVLRKPKPRDEADTSPAEAPGDTE